ncbi:ribonuclease H-like domain-containing protein [Tanacetum coccineum]
MPRILIPLRPILGVLHRVVCFETFRIHKDGDGDALFQLKSDSLPHAHAQTTKTYYKHRDSRIMKAQELKTKTSAQTLIYKIFLQRYQVYQGRLLASFQDDAKYEHVGQDTRSVSRTPQQNGVAKKKNRTLIEATRTMLADSLLPTTFWSKAVNTACYVQNRVLVTKPHDNTPYELLHGLPPSISFMRPFGCPMTILNTLDPLGKFDKKADEGFFVRYSINSKAFRCCWESFNNYDLPTDPHMPNLEDTIDLLNTGIFSGAYDDEDVGAEADITLETTMNVSPIPTTRIHKDHPKDQIIET